MSGNEMEASLLAQCLDLTKQLINSKDNFNMNIMLSSGFTFNFENVKDKETFKSRICEPKKNSTSTIRRNVIKKQKKDTTSTSKPSDNLFNCELCVFEASCKVKLRKHIEKEHSLIPQLNGQEEFVDDIISTFKEEENNNIL